MSIKIDGDSSEIDEPHGRGEDRTVMGGNVTIAKGEVARDVTVFGGNVDMEGKSTGDVTVFGGNVEVHEGRPHPRRRTVFGGKLTLDKGAKDRRRRQLHRRHPQARSRLDRGRRGHGQGQHASQRRGDAHERGHPASWPAPASR